MTDEEENKEEQSKPMSVLEDTKAAIEQLRKEKEEISQIKEELSKLRSEQLLAGTSGGHIEPPKPKELTPKEYADQVMSGAYNGRRD